MAATRAPSAGKDDTSAAVRETITLGTATVAEALASGTIEACAEIPFVSPLFILLKQVKGVVDKAVRRQEELKELHKLCGIITGQVIDKYHATSSEFDISPLQECVEELKAVAEYCGHSRSVLSKLRSLKHGDRIQNLRGRIDQLVPIMGLAAGVNISNRLGAAVQIMDRLMVGPTRKPAPNGLPVCQSWLTMRNGVMDRVLEGFSRGGDPTVVALVGRSGSGKTTAAASFVDLWRGMHRPQEGETEIQARVRSNRAQASFPDGVLWLRVGEGGGRTDRLASLMCTLAQKLYEEILDNSVDDPKTVGYNSTDYIKKLVEEGKGGGRRLCCLVVADDVWEAAVVDKLRETGMWVLATTRHNSVGFDEKVVVDRLPLTEAENLLRGAAGLQQGERMPGEAHTILERCHHVAMDVSFVGRWGTVRTGRDGVAKGKQAWAEALGTIDAQIDAVKREGGNAVGLDDREVNRLAVLRAGFMYLGLEDDNAEKLYAALMVLPDGYGFKVQDAAVLLYNHKVYAEHQMKTVEDAMAILEQWAVLRKEISGLYHMHDAHMHFVRANSEEWAGIRFKAIRRWTSHISCLNVACDMDVYTLAGLWRALKHVGGESWQASRPYDAQLFTMNPQYPSKLFAVHLVGDLYRLDKYDGVETPMRKLIENCANIPEADSQVIMAAVWYLGQGLHIQRRDKEYKENAARLLDMMSSGNQPVVPVGSCSAQLVTVMSKYGLIALTAGHISDAEKWIRKALKAQEDKGLGTSYQASYTLHLLGRCIHAADRPREAEAFFKRALEILEAQVELDGWSISNVLFGLGRCVQAAGRPGEAEKFLKRALEIEEAEMKPDNLSIAYNLFYLAGCVEEAGRPKDAEDLFKRELEILKAEMEPDGLSIACTLFMLGCCVQEAGRPGEAEGFFKRSLEIEEAEMEPDDLSIACTLCMLGYCVQEAGRPEEAEGFFKRALGIREADMGNDGLSISTTLSALARCVRKAGRPEEAEGFLKRALEIKEAEMEPDGLSIAHTLFMLGCCVQEAGRPEQAEGFFERALEIEEAETGPDDLSIAHTLFMLGCCVREAGRPEEAGAFFERELLILEAEMELDSLPIAHTLSELGCCAKEASRQGEAEGLIKRALEIEEAEIEPDGLSIAYTLIMLGCCVQEAGRPEEAEDFFKRALEIKEAETGPEDLSIAGTLSALGWCVQEAGRPEEARAFFERELKVLEAEMELGSLSIAPTLSALGFCAKEADRPGEAEGFFERALEIREAETGPDDSSIVGTLFALGCCVQEAGRPEEAGAFFERALQILESEMEFDSLTIAHTLSALGCCVRKAGRPGEAEVFLKRALEIKEAEMKPDGLSIAYTLRALGWCVQETGRPGEAEGFFRRELEIREAEIKPDNLLIAGTLGALGCCVEKAGRPEEALAFLKRAAEIKEAETGPDDLSVAGTLSVLGR